MQQSKLVDLFSNLNKAHIQFIHKNLVFDNKDAHPIGKLFNYILSYFPNNLHYAALTKENVFTSISSEKYDEKKMLKWMSELLKYLEKSIINEQCESDKFFQRFAIANFYLHNNLTKHFDTEWKSISESILVNEDSQTYFKKFLLEELHIERRLLDNSRYGNYQVLYDNLNNFYNTNLQRIHNLSVTDLKSEIVYNEPNNLLYKIHLQISELFKTNDEALFYVCFDLVSANKSVIAASELKICTVILINYCIHKINNKSKPFVANLFNLYKFLIENNLILEENGEISVATYKNLCTVGLRLGALDYVENFIVEYKKKLLKSVQNDVYQYNYAHLLFYKKNYDEVLRLLSSVRFKDVFYKLSSRRLLIKTYLMLYVSDATYFDILDSSLNAFKKFIYTNKEINEHYLLNNKNFLKFAIKLLNNDKRTLDEFFNELNDVKQIAEYDWFVENASAFFNLNN